MRYSTLTALAAASLLGPASADAVQRPGSLPTVPIRPIQTPALAPAPSTDCAVDRRPGMRIDDIETPDGTVVFWTDVTATCEYSGAPKTFTVPEGADPGSLSVELSGAAGGDSPVGACCDLKGGFLLRGGRGLGAWVRGPISAPPRTVLQIVVGGQGGYNDRSALATPGGYNGGGGASRAARNGAFAGGGGGGATDIRMPPYGPDNRLWVAGGGGGAGATSPSRSCEGASGGAGGGNGGDGRNGCPHQIDDTRENRNSQHGGGYGGGQSAAGAGGDQDRFFWRAQAGSPGSGPNGGTAGEYSEGGGGGGGLFGGGSGNSNGGGGGGGSSRGAEMRDGVRDGHGQAIIRYRVTTGRASCFGNGKSEKGRARGDTRPRCSSLRS